MNFVLVHGAWHGPWCFDALKVQLEAEGHLVIVPYFPGDEFQAQSVSLSVYHKILEEAVFDLEEPFVLCGHSLGGLIISRFASKYPEYIERLIYIAAFIPKPGASLLNCSKADQNADMKDAFLKTANRDYLILDPKVVGNYLYNTCTDNIRQEAITYLEPQRIAVFAEPVEYDKQILAALSKEYIVCKYDRAVSKEAQVDMSAELGCENIILESDHSPFLSMPEAVLDILLRKKI